jgi:phosphohistidine swiveling domain-containing protein
MTAVYVAERPNVLHHVSKLSAAAWTRVNAAEALPGLLTPLGWTFWDARVELALRGAFADMGVLSERDVIVPPTMDERFTAIFYGRFTGNLDMLRACADRTPGTSAGALEEQMFGSVRPGVHDAPTRARYPAIAVKLPWAATTVGRRVRVARANTDAWWRRLTTVSMPRDERTACAVLAEAAERFRTVFRVHLLNSFLSQAAYEQLAALAQDAGRPGLELRLASGFGNMEESRLVGDLWEVSRGRVTLDAFVADHGYHGFSEGDIARHSWREDPAALASLIASYRAQGEDRSPVATARERREDRRLAETELADGLGGRLGALRSRAVLGLADRHIPLREVGKVCFLQAIDVGRCAARMLGEALARRGALAAPEDVYFLSFDELVAGASSELREVVGERRAIHERYARVDLPQAWVGTPEPVEVAIASETNDRIELSGLPIFPGVVEGRAVVVSDPASAAFEPGDILICEFTDPSWAMLMSLAAALVIDIGGPMSHGAIVARELGIPTVISTVDGTRRLRSGDRVRVDAGAGVVELIERAAPEQEIR